MPIIGGISRANYQLIEAELQKNKYREILEEVSIQLGKTEALHEQMQVLRSDYSVMESNADSAEGKISTTFEDKEKINRQSMELLYSEIVTAISDVRAQLSLVQSQYGYWCNEVERIKQWIREEEERIEREKERKKQAFLNYARGLIDEGF